MSPAFESFKQGLQEAITHAKGDERGVRVHRPHTMVSIAQEQFASRVVFSSATLRHEEHDDNCSEFPNN
jgi:putative transcriptional regulator